MNSFDDFKEGYLNLTNLPANNIAKYNKQGSDLKLTTSEYKNYLQTRGCANESELQALNKTNHFTVDDLQSLN